MTCSERLNRRARCTLLAATLLATLLGTSRAVLAEEIHSNGFGGGDWTDPGSWLEKKIPTAADDVVISRGDAIAFDKSEDEKPSCKQIFIDPQGTLTFKSGAGRVICTVGGAIESYGAIKIDGSRSTGDHFELRLVGDTIDARTVKLLKGSALVLNGRRNLAHGKHNVTLSATPGPEKNMAAGKILAGATSMVDLQRAEVVNLNLSTTDIDNTGAKVNERVNIADNHFTGFSHVTLLRCDSPMIVGNFFELAGVPSFPIAALSLQSCPLAELRGNNFKGRYSIGLVGRGMVDVNVSKGTFEGCGHGINWNGANSMLREMTIRGCDEGLVMTSASGVIEDVKIIGCKTGYNHHLSTAQLTNVAITEPPPKGATVLFTSGALSLLNCNVVQEQVKLSPQVQGNKETQTPMVECMYYLVVGAKGKVPDGAMVDVKTAQKSDLALPNSEEKNVRNSPSKLVSGITALPQTLEPLIVNAWSIDFHGKIVESPEYDVTVIMPSKEEGKLAKKLATERVKPDEFWYRSKPNDPEATVEVPLK